MDQRGLIPAELSNDTVRAVVSQFGAAASAPVIVWCRDGRTMLGMCAQRKRSSRRRGIRETAR